MKSIESIIYMVLSSRLASRLTEAFVRKKGIPGRLTSLVIIATLLIAVPAVSLQVIINYVQLNNDYKGNINRASKRISVSFVNPLWDYDLQTLEKIIMSELSNERIRSIRIRHNDTVIIWLKIESGATVHTTKEISGFFNDLVSVPILFRNPVTQKNEQIGTADLWFDTYNFILRYILLVGYDIFEIILILFAISFVIYKITARGLALPIERIIGNIHDASDSIRRKETAHPVPAPGSEPFPELTVMTAGLNSFIHELNLSFSELRISENKYRELATLAGTVIIRIDNSFTIQFANEYASFLLKIPTDQFIGMNAAQSIFKLTPIDTPAIFDPARHAEYSEERFIRPFNHGEGETWISWHIKTIREKETISGYLCAGADITERISAENQIKAMNDILESKVSERTAQYQKAYEELQHSNLALTLTNQSLEEAMESLTSTQKQLILSEKMAVLGQLIAGIAHEINTPLGAISSASHTSLANMNAFTDSLTFFCTLSDSDKRTFRILLAASQDANDNLIFDRIKKREFISFFTSAGAVYPEMLTDMLLSSGYHGTTGELQKMAGASILPKIIEHVYKISIFFRSADIIHNAAQRTSKVVSALQTYSFFNSEEAPVETDIASTIETALTLNYNKIKKGTVLNRDFSGNCTIWSFPDKIVQVWINVINNALHAMNYSGILDIRITKNETAIAVIFKDNGSGIPADIQDKIFSPFFTTKIQGEGTGLGLDICRRIVENIGGRIYFASKPGETVFTVELPLSKGDPNE